MSSTIDERFNGLSAISVCQNLTNNLKWSTSQEFYNNIVCLRTDALPAAIPTDPFDAAHMISPPCTYTVLQMDKIRGNKVTTDTLD